MACVCVSVSVNFSEQNYKISHRPFGLTSSKLHAYFSSFSISCFSKDEETLILAIQFCSLLSDFLLRCFLLMFVFAQSCASLSMMAWFFSQRVFEKLAHCHLREHLHFSCLHKSFTGCHYIIVISVYYITHQMLKKKSHVILLHVLTSCDFSMFLMFPKCVEYTLKLF